MIEAAGQLADRERAIDILYREVEQLVSREILLQAPVASDLRFLLSVLRIAPELERSHDLLCHISSRAGRIPGRELPPRCRGLIEQMGELACGMWGRAADCWYQRDGCAVSALAEADKEMDDLHASMVAYVVVLDPGDETVAVLSGFATDQHLTGAQITAVGAFERATVGWFDREAKDYRPIGVDQQCEVLSLVGDVALGSDGPQPHVHAVLGLPDGSTRGGHLLEGKVWPTLEVIIRETHAGLRKTYRSDIGLALIDLDRDI